MRKALPWEGPSRSGTSISLPLEPGLWQDATRVQYVITGHHLMIMGMSGSGKSFGAAWSLLSELVTRHDVAVLAADVTKGEQSFGPLRPALHLFETTKESARALLTAVHAAIRPRTDFLAERGYQKWQEDCGLTYVVVWLEEAPDIIDSLGDKGRERWLSSLKAARSAGITFVISLQRADWTQLPTLARGQLAKLCMGVENAHDAAFGLSEAQQARNCQPELWATSQPGMAYLHAPGIPDDRIAMPHQRQAIRRALERLHPRVRLCARARSNNGVAAICGCARRIRIAPSVLELGPITCGLCGSDFEPPAAS
jgi:hypothetical protein